MEPLFDPMIISLAPLLHNILSIGYEVAFITGNVPLFMLYSCHNARLELKAAHDQNRKHSGGLFVVGHPHLYIFYDY